MHGRLKRLAVACGLSLLVTTDAAAQRQVTATTPPPPAAAPADVRAPLPLTREGMLEQLAEYDRGLAAIRRSIERWDAARNLPSDFRNTSARRDVLRHVLDAAAEAQMQAARAAAQRDFDAGDWPGVRVQLQPAVTALNGAIERFVGIVSYWRQRVVWDQRIKAWRRALKANDLSSPYDPEMTAREATLNDKVEAGRFAEAARDDLPALFALFSKALQEARATRPDGLLLEDPLRRAPEKACAAPGASPAVASTAGRAIEAPKLRVDRSKPTWGFYPYIASMLGIEGLVSVRVLVTETGCVAWAELTNSSNVSVLDDAGTDWAVNGAVFEPGKVDGKPVPMQTQFNVRFKLRG
jgi:TonB family protein